MIVYYEPLLDASLVPEERQYALYEKLIELHNEAIEIANKTKTAPTFEETSEQLVPKDFAHEKRREANL